jgi:hypothetical protein
VYPRVGHDGKKLVQTRPGNSPCYATLREFNYPGVRPDMPWDNPSVIGGRGAIHHKKHKGDKKHKARRNGSPTFNRGHLHHLAILALRAFVGRPRGIVGIHLGGGTLNESNSSTVQQ